MTIDLSFAEISEYVRAHYGKRVALSRVADRALRVAYEQSLLFTTVQVPVSVTVEEVAADAVTVSYGGGIGVGVIASGVLAFVKARMPELSAAIVSEEGHRIRVELSRLPQTKALVDALALNDIQVLENEIQITASLK